MTTIAIVFFLMFGVFSDLKAQKIQLSELLNDIEQTDSDTLFAINKLDVFKYYGLTQYDTELKRKAYKKSEKYAVYLSVLQEMRKQLFNKTFYFIFKDDFYNCDYKLIKGGFSYTISTSSREGYVISERPKTINSVIFPMLPTITYKDESYDKLRNEYPFYPYFNEDIVIPVNEDNALLIENDRENSKIYFIFNLSGCKNVVYKSKHPILGLSYFKEEVFVASMLRIVVANTKTDEIYFDKIYQNKSK